MLRLNRILDRTAAQAVAADAVRLSLSFAERSKSRLVIQPEHGPAIAITLPRGSVLRDGTVLGGDAGEIAVVTAAPELLARVTSTDPLALMRAVYHLANRHVAIQLNAAELLIERDPVLERLLLALGLTVEAVEAPFEPESGAYFGHGAPHGHHTDVDQASASIGESLSIEAHRARNP
jgi:urease accessory protein